MQIKTIKNKEINKKEKKDLKRIQEKPIQTLDLEEKLYPELKRISMREYIRHYTDIHEEVNENNQKVVITHQDKDMIMISPMQSKKRKWTFEDLKEIRFKGPKNLSKNIDKIVYGI